MNDERPIEKLLRRAAKQRSNEAGPPPELHPANRRQLQDEVTRQFPKPEAPEQSALAEFWTLLTRRWIYGVGIFAVVWIVALAVVPMISKPKSKMKLALNAPGESRIEMEFATNTPAVPAPAIAAAPVMESDSAGTIRPSGGGNFVAAPEPTAAPPVVAALTASADSAVSVRRDIQDTSTKLAYSAAASGTIQPTPRAETKARLGGASSNTESFARAAPTTVAQRAQPTRSSEFGSRSGGSGGGNVISIVAETGLKIEEQHFTNTLGADRQFDAVGASAVAKSAAPTVTTADGFADKNWIARGGGGERERASLNSQAYSNVGAEQLQNRKKESPASKDLVPVLANFKIAQQGRQLQVIDGDGSTYNGVVDEENTLYKQIVDRQKKTLSNSYNNQFRFQTPKLADAPPAPKQSEANYYLYRVEGTNRTLNQNVVFTWNFVDTNNSLAAAQLDYKAAAQKLDATKLPSQFPALLQNSFINGRAQFGEGREIEVNAVPVK